MESTKKDAPMQPHEAGPYLKRLYYIIHKEIDITLSTYFSLKTLHNKGLSEWPSFGVIAEGLEYQLIFQFYRILSDSKNECNINRLLGFLENNYKELSWEKNIDPTRPLRDKRAIAKNPTFLRLKNRRHKYFAHYDQEYFMDPRKIEIDHPFDVEEFDELYKFVKDITDYYMSCYDPHTGTVPSRWLMHSATERIASILAEARASQERVRAAKDLEEHVFNRETHGSVAATRALAEAYADYHRAIATAEGQKQAAELAYARSLAEPSTDERSSIIWEEYRLSSRTHDDAVARRCESMPY